MSVHNLLRLTTLSDKNKVININVVRVFQCYIALS